MDAPCPICHDPVPASVGRGRPRKYCSVRCGKKAARDSSTRVCSEADCNNYVRAKGLCSYHYKLATYPDHKQRWPEDPEKRRRSLRAKTQKRRALVNDPQAEVIDRDEIGARDGWRCGLCSRRVDNTLPYPHPQSASLDHIEPLSLGGRHVRENVQIAHLTCNIAKGNGGGGEQLLLIG